jgi:hypothetical protein
MSDIDLKLLISTATGMWCLAGLDYEEKVVLRESERAIGSGDLRGERFEELRRTHIEGRRRECELCRECDVWEHRHPGQYRNMAQIHKR